LKIFPKTREPEQRAAGDGYKATTEHTANSKSTRCIYLAWRRRRRQRSEVRWNFECVTTRFSLPPARPEAVVFVIKIFHDLLEDSSTDSLPLFRPALWPSLSLAPLLLTLSNSMLTQLSVSRRIWMPKDKGWRFTARAAKGRHSGAEIALFNEKVFLCPLWTVDIVQAS